MHKPLRTVGLHIFLVIWTIIIFGVVFVLVAFNEKAKSAMLRELPAIHYLLVAIGVEPDEIQREGVSLTERLSDFLHRKLSGKNQDSEYWLKMGDEKPTIRLYSPVYMFQGLVSSGASYVHIYYSHPGRDRQKELLVETISEDNTWQFEVSLGKETVYNGTNEYLIEVVFADGKKIERHVKLQVDYQRIEVGESILYLDPHYIPPTSDEDILLEIPDFEREPTNMITYGCDTAYPQQGILIEHDYQFATIPACLSFSLKKQYLLWFAFRQKQPDAFLYDIMLPGGTVLIENYPLYAIEMGNVYLGLVFWDEPQQVLKTLRAVGDLLRYQIQIDRFDTQQQLMLARIRHQDGHTLTIETQREKLIMYMYKEWDNYYALVHPGLRYQYFLKGVRDSWRKINEGSFSSLTKRLIAPGSEKVPTFGFTLALEGNILHIDDGYQHNQIDIFALGSIGDTVLNTYPLDQPDACTHIEANFYGSLSGTIARQGVAYRSVILAGKGAWVSTISVLHNGKTAALALDEHYLGTFSIALSKSKQTLVSGENIYTIIATDQRGQEICRKEMRLQIE